MRNYIQEYKEKAEKLGKSTQQVEFILTNLRDTIEETNGMTELEQENIIDSFMSELFADANNHGQTGEESKAEAKKKSEHGTMAQYHEIISKAGNFWLDDMTDDMYDGDTRVGEHLYMDIHMRIRDICLGRNIAWQMQLSEIALKGYLNGKRHHKLLNKFDALPTWDGKDHIGELASCVHGESRLGIRRAFEIWFTKCFERVINHRHNVVMVWKGKENIRKSSLVRFIASPFADMYAESPVRPASKDDRLARTSRFIQEIPEIHDSMNARNMNAFKTFVTEEKTTDRKPYDHTSIEKANNCNYIATANEDGHLFQDVDGLRRFLIVQVQNIDHRYDKVDIMQVWAQAKEMWKQGKHEMTEDELVAKKADIADETAQDPVHEIMDAYIVEGTEEDFIPNIDIMQLLREQGIQISNRSQETTIGSLRKVWFSRKGAKQIQRKIDWKKFDGFIGFKISEK